MTKMAISIGGAFVWGFGMHFLIYSNLVFNKSRVLPNSYNLLPRVGRLYQQSPLVILQTFVNQRMNFKSLQFLRFPALVRNRLKILFRPLGFVSRHMLPHRSAVAWSKEINVTWCVTLSIFWHIPVFGVYCQEGFTEGQHNTQASSPSGPHCMPCSHASRAEPSRMPICGKYAAVYESRNGNWDLNVECWMN